MNIRRSPQTAAWWTPQDRFLPRLTPVSLLALCLSVSCGSKEDPSALEEESGTTSTTVEDTDPPPGDSGGAPASNPIAGVYTLTEVTCAGTPVDVSVDATITFDEFDYLEEWEFPGLECTMALEGVASIDETTLMLLDVDMICSDACATEGIPCHDEACSSDQRYTYSLTGDELLLRFTQMGDEFSCGPCGDGVESTYRMVRAR